jgi:putative addiction module antidote
MSTLKIRKVGNSLGVIFPKEIQEALNITEGDVIDVTTLNGNKVILDSHLPHHSKWIFKDAELSTEDREWLDADLEDDNDKSSRW